MKKRKKRIFDFFKRESPKDEYVKKENIPSIYEQWGEPQQETNLRSEPNTVNQKPDESQKEKSKIIVKSPEEIKYTPKKVYYKKTVDKKLTIILLENTKRAVLFKDIILKIIQKLERNDYICIINYGSMINANKVIMVKDFRDENLFKLSDLGDKCCLYDSFKVLIEAIKIARYKILDDIIERHSIKYIDVIGIGSGFDIGSTITKSEAVTLFDKVINTENVETKYFCFSEEGFINVAALGFRSIGAFPKRE